MGPVGPATTILCQGGYPALSAEAWQSEYFAQSVEDWHIIPFNRESETHPQTTKPIQQWRKRRAIVIVNTNSILLNPCMHNFASQFRETVYGRTPKHDQRIGANIWPVPLQRYCQTMTEVTLFRNKYWGQLPPATSCQGWGLTELNETCKVLVELSGVVLNLQAYHHASAPYNRGGWVLHWGWASTSTYTQGKWDQKSELKTRTWSVLNLIWKPEPSGKSAPELCLGHSGLILNQGQHQWMTSSWLRGRKSRLSFVHGRPGLFWIPISMRQDGNKNSL